jgi:hypothetical protein
LHVDVRERARRAMVVVSGRERGADDASDLQRGGGGGGGERSRRGRLAITRKRNKSRRWG